MTAFPKPKSEYVWIDVSGPINEKPLAYLFDTDAGEIWIPKSQLGARKKTADLTGFKRIEIPRWLAAREGLIDSKDGD